jgi:hypothetical protein
MLLALFEFRIWRLRWKNGNARSAAISTIREREIPKIIFLRVPPLKRSLRIGFVQFAVHLKINSSRNSRKAPVWAVFQKFNIVIRATSY